MITQKRTTPLIADGNHDDHDEVMAETADLESSVVPVVAHRMSPKDREERDTRFTEGVRTLRVGGASIQLSERILLILGGIVAPLGLVLILLGYLGVSQTPFAFEQNSYIISGGIFGLALVFLGSFFYFAHWMTQLVKEHRVQSVAMLEAIQRLQDEVSHLRDGEVAATPPGLNGHDRDAVLLVATPRGTMAHRADCTVVAGKTDLRRVEPAEDLTPCKLCLG